MLDDSCYERKDGLKFIMSPPIRKAADQEALWRGLRGGELDTIGTDHCSFTMAQKARGKDDFSMTPNGGAGVQHRGQLLYTYGVCKGRISIEQMVSYLSSNAAKLFGMPQHGAISEGKAADIVIWDPSYDGVITNTNHAYNCDNSIYDGIKVQGCAHEVLLNGELSVSGAKLIKTGGGKYIPRQSYSKLR